MPNSMILQDSYMINKVDVIIPTKSNFTGLVNLLDSIKNDPALGQIVIIADGENAYNTLLAISQTYKFDLLSVPLGIGIHKMWNMGMDKVQPNNQHIAIINDDVVLSPNTLSISCDILNNNSDIGLLCPWSDLSFQEYFMPTSSFAGFCMIMPADLVSKWRFDERMKWWYGDDDVKSWVSRVANKKIGITGKCHAIGNMSHTINGDPPPNFHAAVINDEKLYREKWGNR